MTHIFNKPIVTIFEEPNKKSPISDEGLYGMSCKILGENNDFYEIKTFYNYIGFVQKDDIEIGIMPNYVIQSNFADLLPTPEYKYPSSITLPIGSRVNIDISDNNRFARVILNNGNALYTHKSNIEKYKITTKNISKNLVKSAKKYLNTQYRWGGKTPLGIDCSGLCFMAYYLNGYLIHRDADFYKSEILKQIDYSKAQPGDLLFFPGHIGMYIGNDMFIHSTGSFGLTRINSLNPNSKIYSKVHHYELKVIATLK